tara:strand:- start:886 stop:1248 length:363 start_codon:yes stop_codon:yes gene_type:complete
MDKLIKKIKLPEIIDQRGSLSFLESNNHIPFNIKSTSIITNLSFFSKNNKFIKNKEKEFLVVLSGFLDIRIKHGEFEEVFKLNKPNVGLYIPDMAEKSFVDFSPNLILLVLCADDLNKEN